MRRRNYQLPIGLLFIVVGIVVLVPVWLSHPPVPDSFYAPRTPVETRAVIVTEVHQ